VSSNARAARAALLALGEGLALDSPARALDDTGALAQVRAATAALVAARTDVVLPVLDAAATGAELDADADTALRGLGYLLADEEAATVVTTAVQAALRAGAAGAFAGEVAGVQVAVLNYGQRVRYALAWSAALSRAVDRQILWVMTVKPLVAAVPGGGGDLLGALEGVAADFFDADGDVEIGPDTGRVWTPEDAESFAVATLGTQPVEGARVTPGAAARVGFDRAGAAFGPLTPPATSLLDQLDDFTWSEPGRGHRHGR
jgi:hypothetical protein